ncbi:J domain-containing protein [Methylobacterium durans]|uniref:Molecular chaperone DnaJ n=1 Tax=Methylobacterium durans TaxID=2202825 RepID=A0A2U8W441_9HYPH|nr:DnaJ domain-containing protein [Methylobacterium durans]AWN40839.1 molecular chaperone DnaJ [Methylobacterium durans]
MALALGVLACLALWWFSRRNGRFDASRFWPLLRRVGGWGALALAFLLGLRGRADLALVLGLAGVWFLDGGRAAGQRFGDTWRRLTGRARNAPLIAFTFLPDGSPGDGRVLAGPLAGRNLSELPPPALRDLLRACRRQDPAGATGLEMYLDRRLPGWRVDAEGDRDARTGRPAQPGAMTEEEAHEILGLERGASPEQIRAAHRTLMKRIHPDQGGTAGLAARVNAARDRLLNRHR